MVIFNNVGDEIAAFTVVIDNKRVNFMTQWEGTI